MPTGVKLLRVFDPPRLAPYLLGRLICHSHAAVAANGTTITMVVVFVGLLTR